MKKPHITIPFQCPYNEFSCDFSSSSNENSDMTCQTCPHYNHGVKATGAMRGVELLFKLTINLFRKLLK
jgi:hypothetical protein